jgi:hypothetical protein
MITGAETAHLGTRHSPIFLEGRLALADAPSAQELGLQEGQVVRANVQAREGGLQMSLGGRFFDLPRDLPPSLRLSAGDNLLFRVQVQNDGSIVLHPVTTAPATPSAPASSAATSIWPGRNQQLELRPPDMGLLSQLLRPGVLEGLAQQVASASPQLAMVVDQWLRQRASMAQLTPDKLKQIFSRSGWMNEALSAQKRGPEGPDLKSTLKQLLGALEKQDADGVHLVKNAIDDIESRQMAAAESLTAREWAFSIMLPFRDADPVSLRFSKSRQQPGQESPPFVIQLHTRNQDLGELWLQTCISHQTDVDMVMWVMREDIAVKAQAQSAALAEELEGAGLRMTRLQIVHGSAPQDLANWVPPDTGSMVDVRT